MTLAADEMTDLLTDTVTIESFVSRDGYGKPSYAPGVPYQCRIIGGSKETVSASGVEDTSTVAFFIAGSQPIQAGDRVTLPSRYSPISVFVQRAETFSDEHGPHHMRIVCGWSRITG